MKAIIGNFGTSGPLGQIFWEAKLTQIRPYYREIALAIGVPVGLKLPL